MKLNLFLTASLCLIHALPMAAHPDKVEDRLVLQFATGVHPPKDGVWEDLTHQFTAKVHGSPTLTNIGPALALSLNGVTDYLSVEMAPDRLPKKELTVAAWVLLNDTMRDGGMIGYIQDDGATEGGFMLGYDQRSFTFSLAARGNGEKAPVLTRIRARSPLKLGYWHHVVGTYDGARMRLWVNGIEEAVSTQQSGEMAYPDQAVLAVGAYKDPNEFNAMDGALYQTKLYARVLDDSEIAGEVARNRALVDFDPPVNKLLKFIVTPYLQFGTKTSMTIMCETSGPARMVVEYGEFNALSSRMEGRSSNLIQG
ncbi:MAG: LamG domain-containing protein, partial [Limisphaerales bacterium]